MSLPSMFDLRHRLQNGRNAVNRSLVGLACDDIDVQYGGDLDQFPPKAMGLEGIGVVWPEVQVGVFGHLWLLPPVDERQVAVVDVTVLMPVCTLRISLHAAGSSGEPAELVMRTVIVAAAARVVARVLSRAGAKIHASRVE